MTAWILMTALLLGSAGVAQAWPATAPAALDLKSLASLERDRVLPAADRFLTEEPVTVTATHSPRCAGGPHDFFSEGDYWWPDPQNPNGPYIQRDGQTNPDNF